MPTPLNFTPILFSFVFLLSTSLLAQVPDGKWRTNCVAGTERLQVYNAFQVHTEENFFTSLSCDQLNARFITIGQVEYVKAAELKTNQINFTYRQVLLSLHRPELVSDFNRRRVCGFDNWSFADAKDITGLRCELFQPGSATAVASAGDRRYGIYALSDGKLYYGKLSLNEDGSSPEKRPRSLQLAIEYTFQKSL